MGSFEGFDYPDGPFLFGCSEKIGPFVDEGRRNGREILAFCDSFPTRRVYVDFLIFERHFSHEPFPKRASHEFAEVRVRPISCES